MQKMQLCLFTKKGLDKHIKQVHNKMKDYQCEQCSYVCSQKEDIDKHIKQVHSKIKDYQCEQCSYACSIKDDLDKHIRQVHNKLKGYQCEQYSYVCSQKEDLDKHIKQAHNKFKVDNKKQQILSSTQIYNEWRQKEVFPHLPSFIWKTEVFQLVPERY